MIRTSLVLPPALHQYLSLMAQQSGKPFSVLVRDILARFADEQASQQVGNLYAALDQMKGLVTTQVAGDTAQTIDEQLYGSHAAWRSDPQQVGLWTLPETAKKNEN